MDNFIPISDKTKIDIEGDDLVGTGFIYDNCGVICERGLLSFRQGLPDLNLRKVGFTTRSNLLLYLSEDIVNMYLETGRLQKIGKLSRVIKDGFSIKHYFDFVKKDLKYLDPTEMSNFLKKLFIKNEKSHQKALIQYRNVEKQDPEK